MHKTRCASRQHRQSLRCDDSNHAGRCTTRSATVRRGVRRQAVTGCALPGSGSEVALSRSCVRSRSSTRLRPRMFLHCHQRHRKLFRCAQRPRSTPPCGEAERGVVASDHTTSVAAIPLPAPKCRSVHLLLLLRRSQAPAPQKLRGPVLVRGRPWVAKHSSGAVAAHVPPDE